MATPAMSRAPSLRTSRAQSLPARRAICRARTSLPRAPDRRWGFDPDRRSLWPAPAVTGATMTGQLNANGGEARW